MTAPREFTLQLSEPWSVNVWARKSHRERNMKRDRIAREIAEQLPKGWKPLKRYRLEVDFYLHQLRDWCEIGFSLKTEMDAAEQAKLILDDSPRCLPEMPLFRQQVRRGATGVTLRFIELER